jgi:hypothetical protein
MRLYVCYGTWGNSRHPCGRAYKALRAAGHDPQVVRTYGCYGTDRFFKGRCAVKEMTGSYKVPTLVLDDESVVDESQKIVDWAAAHPA